MKHLARKCIPIGLCNYRGRELGSGVCLSRCLIIGNVGGLGNDYHYPFAKESKSIYNYKGRDLMEVAVREK